jgi:hypothetical protein
VWVRFTPLLLRCLRFRNEFIPIISGILMIQRERELQMAYRYI